MDSRVKQTVINQFAEFIVAENFKPTPGVIEIIRLAMIDTLGCMWVGAKQNVVEKTLNSVCNWGLGQSPVFGRSERLPPPWAAMVNGVSAHCLDFDDWETPGNTHPSAVIFPALLAESHRRNISGEQIIDAYIAGFEVIARLGEAMNFEHYDKGWHATSSLGTIGAAAAVSRLLKLDAIKTANAMAISVSMSSGLTRQFGSDTKSLHAGWAAKSGLMAANLAEQGLTGQSDVLLGDRGFNTLTSYGDDSRFDAALEKLGKPLAISEYGLVTKPYPCCAYTHRLIDCAIELHQQIQNTNGELISIQASLPNFHAAILPYQQPKNKTQAQFSVPYCLAVALIYGKVGLKEFEPNYLTSEKIKSLIDISHLNIRAPKNPDLNFDSQDPDYLLVKDNKGNCWRAESIYPLGSPQNTMSIEQVNQKFESNTGIKPSVALKNWTSAMDIDDVLDQLNAKKG